MFLDYSSLFSPQNEHQGQNRKLQLHLKHLPPPEKRDYVPSIITNVNPIQSEKQLPVSWLLKNT